MKSKFNVSISFILVFMLFFCPVTEAKERIKITGEYQYTYGDKESVMEAKAICYSMAVRNAIESYKTFIVTISTVKDFQLVKDIVQTISSGYIEDLKIIEENINGRTVYTKIEGYIIPAEVDRAIKREIQKTKKPEVIAENGCVKILKASRKEEFISLIYTVIDNVCRDSTILIDFYDKNGDPLESGKQKANLNGMIAGELKTIKFLVPPPAKSYRIWFPEKDNDMGIPILKFAEPPLKKNPVTFH